MLWYKSWLETRWRFVIGLGLLMFSAAATVLAYPQVLKLLPTMPPPSADGEFARRIAEAAELMRDYRGYVWSEWFHGNMPKYWTLFAVLLGTGGLLSQVSAGGGLYTLSLPATRTRLLTTRLMTALGQLFVLAIIPAIVVPLSSPAIGQRYSVGAALIHSACLYIAGTVLFSLTVLLSTVFGDVWRPPLIVLCAAVVLSVAEQFSPALERYGLFRVMSAEQYFRSGTLPWLGLLISAALSAALLYAATRRIARQDF